MKLEHSTNQLFLLELTQEELGAIQAGLRETLEALDEWEFQTRTGIERSQMREILDDLAAERKQLDA